MLTHTERLRERAFAFTEPEFSLDEYADVELSRRAEDSDGDGEILSPCEFTSKSKIFFAVYLHWEDHNGHTYAEWQADFWRLPAAQLFAAYLGTECLMARVAEGKDFDSLLDAILELPECPLE